jgi:hypothetical protein
MRSLPKIAFFSSCQSGEKARIIWKYRRLQKHENDAKTNGVSSTEFIGHGVAPLCASFLFKGRHLRNHGFGSLEG